MTLPSLRKPLDHSKGARANGLRSLVTKGARAWTWRLLCEDAQIASGYADTQREALEAVRNAKSKRLGKPLPQPLAPRRPNRKESK